MNEDLKRIEDKLDKLFKKMEKIEKILSVIVIGGVMSNKDIIEKLKNLKTKKLQSKTDASDEFDFNMEKVENNET